MALLSPVHPLREGYRSSFDLPAPRASRLFVIPGLLRSLKGMGRQQWRSRVWGGHGVGDGGPGAGEGGEGGHELHRPSLEQRVVVVGNPWQTLGLAGGSHGGQEPGSSGPGGFGQLIEPLRQLAMRSAHCLGFSLGPLPDNSISTGKYTLLTFLPRNLFEQFHRAAYLYFLALILVNQIPVLAVFGRFLSLVPLLSVLTVTAIKDAYEDILRHLADRRENNRPCLLWASPGARGHSAAPAFPASGPSSKGLLRWPPWHRRTAAVGPGSSEGSRGVELGEQLSAPESPLQHRDPLLTGGSFREGRWAQVQVGDVLRVSCDEAVPCDMLILCSSDETGRVFVETANLDGETSLKARFAVPEGESLLRTAVLHGAEDEVRSRRTSVSLPLLRQEHSSNSAGGTMPLSAARRTASEVVRPSAWEHGQERPSTAPLMAHPRPPLSPLPPLPHASTVPLPTTSSAGARLQASGVAGTPMPGVNLAISGADVVDPFCGPRGPELGVVVAEPPNRSIYEFSGYWELPRSGHVPLPVPPPGAPLGLSGTSSGVASDAALAAAPDPRAGSPLPMQSQQVLGPGGAPPGSPLPSAAESSTLSAHAPAPAGESMSVPLGPGNMLLRSCVVRNTGWVVGLAIYTGRDCKVVLNASGAQSKRSRVEAHMNRDMLLLALLLVLLCLVGAVGMVAWLAQWPDVLALPYLGAQSQAYAGVAGEGAINFFSLLILFQVLVPISLYISIELIRLGQTYFMARDRHMQDARWGGGQGLLCRALNVNEDLGQVQHVLTDKTGTLTQNRMEFHSCSVRGSDMTTVLSRTLGGYQAGNPKKDSGQQQRLDEEEKDKGSEERAEPRQSPLGTEETQPDGPPEPSSGIVAEVNTTVPDEAVGFGAPYPTQHSVHAPPPAEQGCEGASRGMKQGPAQSMQPLDLRPETARLFVQAVSRLQDLSPAPLQGPASRDRPVGSEMGHWLQGQVRVEPSPEESPMQSASHSQRQRQAQQEAEEGLDLFLLVLAACNSVVPTVVSFSATTGLVEMHPSTGLEESERASQHCSSASTPALFPAAYGSTTSPLLSTYQSLGARPPADVGQQSRGQEEGRGLGLAALGDAGSGREGPALESLEGCVSSTSFPPLSGPLGSTGEALGPPGEPEAGLGLEFQGESPDEIALVKAAQQLGCTLMARGSSSVTLDWRAHGTQELQVLGVHEFDSARKRMSVVVRSPEGKAWLLVKGADSAMFPLFAASGDSSVPRPQEGRQEAQDEGAACDPGKVEGAASEVGPGTSWRGESRPAPDGLSREQTSGEARAGNLEQAKEELGRDLQGQEAAVVERTRQHVEAYSCLGLRTLVLGVKELTREELTSWVSGYQQAQKGLGGLRTTLLMELAVQVEQGLHCVGATGIEDRLQEGVPETLQLLAGAGIKVWMLTGDKPETAESIARSCGLLPPGMDPVGLHALGPCEAADCQEALAKARAALEQAPGLPPGHPAHTHQDAPQRGT